jgi:alkanesulfonate monooxygenase
VRLPELSPAVTQMVPAGRNDNGSVPPARRGLAIFATTPPSKDADPATYVERVCEIARWSEAAGCEGTLVYTDNGLLDPWLLSQSIISRTERICPLVALQPVYMHPYTAAKMVASLAFMYRRRVWLNIVAGGFVNDLTALGDDTAHDDRYERIKEYARIVLDLLAGKAVTFSGDYYDVKNLRLTPTVPEELQPGLMVSGSSPAGYAAARAIGAVPVRYPQPPGEEMMTEDGGEFGIRVGIIARETGEEAWRIARERFPEDRRGRIAHTVAMKVSDSHWHMQLSRTDVNGAPPNPYWLHPFQNYKTFCPYLVGAYEHVAALLAAYIELGTRTFILDIPASEEELWHTGIVMRAAAEVAA